MRDVQVIARSIWRKVNATSRHHFSRGAIANAAKAA
jgi:hypothetical protein